jgi:hypothetical protein
MLNNILHKIAAALGAAAAYMYWDDFLALVKKMLLLSVMLGVAHVLYAAFYLDDSLTMITEKFF